MDIKESYCQTLPPRVPVAVFALVAFLSAPVAAAQSNPSARAASVETDGQVGFLVADKVYAEPDALSREVPSIGRDVRVRVTPLPDASGWHTVYRADTSERIGYTFLPHVSRFGAPGLSSYDLTPPAAEPLPEVVFADVEDEDGIPHTVNTWSNVRAGAGLDYPAFGVIRPNRPFLVLATEDGWGTVRLEGERAVGYVSSDLLNRVPDPESPTAAEELPLRSVTASSRAAGGGGLAEGMELAQAEELTQAENEPTQAEGAAAAELGALTVLVRPWGSIYIDDTLHRGETDAQYSVELPAGTHHVQALHPALGTVERTVLVRAGESQQLVLDFNAERLASHEAASAEPTGPETATPGPLVAVSETSTDEVYDRAEEPPILLGGQEGLQRLAEYPEQAYTFGVEGRVLIQFIVDATGQVRDPAVVRGLGMGCDEEALRLVRQARFIPGTVGGQPVSVKHTLSIDFRIEG